MLVLRHSFVCCIPHDRNIILLRVNKLVSGPLLNSVDLSRFDIGWFSLGLSNLGLLFLESTIAVSTLPAPFLLLWKLILFNFLLLNLGRGEGMIIAKLLLLMILLLLYGWLEIATVEIEFRGLSQMEESILLLKVMVQQVIPDLTLT